MLKSDRKPLLSPNSGDSRGLPSLKLRDGLGLPSPKLWQNMGFFCSVTQCEAFHAKPAFFPKED